MEDAQISGLNAGPRCRLCDAVLGTTFVDLGMSPLANAYLKRQQLQQMEAFFPLCVYVCDECRLVQLPECESPERIFGDEYLYFSSYSSSWLKHAEDFCHFAMERSQLDGNSLVVELASNDGYLLQYFKAAGVPVLGVEPARNVAAVAESERGIPTLVQFFGTSVGQQLSGQGKSADLIVANNVLAHVPKLLDFLGGVKTLLSPGGIFSAEFPHLKCLIDDKQFDTIYHEHFSYFSFGVLRRALAKMGLRVFDVQQLPTHGGSLRVSATHVDSVRWPEQPSVTKLLGVEREAGYDTDQAYTDYASQVAKIRFDLLTFLMQAYREGKSVVGYGAAAKGNTLLNYCGIRSDLVSYTVDRNPHKQGRYLPGSHLEILSPDALEASPPDYVLILPWNLKQEICQQLSQLRAHGTRFVVPIPELEVL